MASVLARAGLFMLVALAFGGCSIPAEVACLPGLSPCNGECIAVDAVCPGRLPDNGGDLGVPDLHVGCQTPNDCSAPASACVANTCIANLCGIVPAPTGTPCNENGGSQCNGQGACVVGCSAPTDCPATGSACRANLCNPTSRACELVDAPAGVGCNEGGGTRCDGNGSCVGCMTANDCSPPPTNCWMSICDSAHSCGVAPALPGGSCNVGGGTVCDGNGNCVAQAPPGATCSANAQCTSGLCGTSGSGSRCCATACPTGPCGATDCDAAGACLFMPFGMFCGTGQCNGQGTCVMPCGQPGYKCVFVTSALFDGALGGAAGADDKCAALASAANVAGAFTAWLSAGVTSAAQRIGASTLPYVLVDGSKIAASSSQLASGSISGPIDRDEAGRLVAPSAVWTNTNADGTTNAVGACTDFSSNAPTDAPVPVAGVTSAADLSWTSNSTLTCDAMARLYCFER
jgi:hypothetical protein